MKNFQPTNIEGLYVVENFMAEDSRGVFVKTFLEAELQKLGMNEPFRESYYSVSKKNVIRGMHFQAPPHDHLKLVYATSGVILDVILDIRKASSTYGKYFCIQLREFGNSVLIPKGCAHGFLSLTDSATVVYNVTTTYHRDSDGGVLWNSFGFDWNIENCIISERDLSFKQLKDFNSPF